MKLSRRAATAALALIAALAGGCRSDSASYMINGPELSLTLIVDQNYLWDDEWQLGLLTTRQPDCMRRHNLQPAPLDGLKLDVYQAADGAYIVKQGNNWYIAETKKCQLQRFKAPPPEPGELRGSFEFKDGKLTFVALPKPPAPPQAVATPAGATPAAAPAGATSAATAPAAPAPTEPQAAPTLPVAPAAGR